MPQTEEQLVAEIEAAIRAEMEEEKSRGSSIDRDAVRTGARQTIKKRIIEASGKVQKVSERGVRQPDPARKAVVQAYATVVDRSIGRLDALIIAHPSKKAGNQRFSKEAHALGAEAYELYAMFRGRFEKRLSTEGEDLEIRTGGSVGITLAHESPLVVRDATARMVATISNPAYAERFKVRDLDAATMLAQLVPGLAVLEAAIGQDGGTTRGENTVAIEKELVFLDIALERVIVKIEDGLAKEDARGLEAVVPRKAVRRSGEKKEDGEEGEENEESQPDTDAAGTAAGAGEKAEANGKGAPASDAGGKQE